MPMDPLTRKRRLEQKKAKKPIKAGKVVPGQTPGPKTVVKVKRKAF
jgi:hypothetical protein